MNNYINTLHKDSEGYITVAKMGSHWQQYYFEGINDLSINLKGKDVYISQNTFNNKSRRLIHLKELKALYIDIDCYKMNLSKEVSSKELLEILKWRAKEENIKKILEEYII